MTRISVVSYLNSRPFLEGFEKYYSGPPVEISRDIPSVCAHRLITDQADIGLIPVAMIPSLKEPHIVSDYCIAADGNVDSVVLLSHLPLVEIKRIRVDMESRTSATLVRILANELWKINPEWLPEDENSPLASTEKDTAIVVIGDRALRMRNQFPYCYDLSAEWKKMTGMPFVFAAWVSNKETDPICIDAMNRAFGKSLANLESLVTELEPHYPGTDIKTYLGERIRYRLGDKEKAAMELFLQKASILNLEFSGPVVAGKIA